MCPPPACRARGWKRPRAVCATPFSAAQKKRRGRRASPLPTTPAIRRRQCSCTCCAVRVRQERRACANARATSGGPCCAYRNRHWSLFSGNADRTGARTPRTPWRTRRATLCASIFCRAWKRSIPARRGRCAAFPKRRPWKAIFSKRRRPAGRKAAWNCRGAASGRLRRRPRRPSSAAFSARRWAREPRGSAFARSRRCAPCRAVGKVFPTAGSPRKQNPVCISSNRPAGRARPFH